MVRRLRDFFGRNAVKRKISAERKRGRRLSLQSLEMRQLWAADMGHMMMPVRVTEDAIITHHDIVPRFAAEPTITAVNPGLWSATDTWDAGRVPSANDVVAIPTGLGVIYDVHSTARLDAIEVGGSLVFHPSTDTSLWLNELTVLPSGSLLIGTQSLPVAASVSAEIVFTDTPGSNGNHYKAGDVSNPGIDPEQWGNGLLVFGNLQIHGAEKTPFVRATHNLHPGSTSIQVDAPVSQWDSGDELLVPETSQTPMTFRGVDLAETETVSLAGATGTMLQLANGLEYHHHGIAENRFGIERYPHIANLTRNVVLRSENPDGVRGHFSAFADATLNISYAEFQSLGRTSADSPIDNTLFDDAGGVVQIGTNQSSRYPVHMHHLNQPFHVDGIVVQDGLKWGIAVHGSDHGVIENSVVYDVDGAGIVTEDGTEIGNTFTNNLVVKVDGGHQTAAGLGGAELMLDAAGDRFVEIAADGSGFWLRATANAFQGNTVYDAAGYAFNFNGYFRSPNVVNDPYLQQFDDFSNNEAVSSRGGLWLSFPQGHFQINNYQPQTVADFLAWHVQKEGIRDVHNANLVLDGFTVIGDPNVSSLNEASSGSFEVRSLIGISLSESTYSNLNYQLRDIQIEGANVGIMMPTNPGDQGLRLDNAVLGNYINIAFPERASTDSLRASNVTYLPSRVSRINESYPAGVANLWHEREGTLQPGWEQIDDSNLALPTPPLLNFSPRLGIVTVEGTEADDILVVNQGSEIISIEVPGYRAVFRVQEVALLSIHGKGGNDQISNHSDIPSFLFGGDGDDWILGGKADDWIFGGAGTDVIFGRAGNDYLVGGEGEDLIYGAPGVDQIFTDFPPA